MDRLIDGCLVYWKHINLISIMPTKCWCCLHCRCAITDTLSVGITQYVGLRHLGQLFTIESGHMGMISDSILKMDLQVSFLAKDMQGHTFSLSPDYEQNFSASPGFTVQQLLQIHGDTFLASAWHNPISWKLKKFPLPRTMS